MMMDINDSFIFKDSPFKDEKYQHNSKQNFGVNDKNAKNTGDKLKMLQEMLE